MLNNALIIYNNRMRNNRVDILYSVSGITSLTHRLSARCLSLEPLMRDGVSIVVTCVAEVAPRTAGVEQ